MQRHNFGRNIELRPATFYEPRSGQEVVDILDRHRGQKIRVIGRLHSWSRILESEEVLLDLRHLNQVVPQLDGDLKSAQVGAGCQIKRLLSELSKKSGWTIPSVGFVAEQSIAGAISTGTHGSGKHSLSHYVLSVRIARYDSVTGRARIDEINEGHALRAARCSLGCLGVILSVRMQCRESYRVEEHFHEYSTLAEVMNTETTYPLQQFYLVPWRWTYFVQHRREMEDPISQTAILYRWYRFLIIDVAMHFPILLVARWFPSRRLLHFVYRYLVPSFVIRNWRSVDHSTRQLVMGHELFRHIEIELFVQKRHVESAMLFVTDTLCLTGSEQGAAIPRDPLFQSQIAQAGTEGELMDLAGVYDHHFPICVRKILTDDTLISMASSGIKSSAGIECTVPDRINEPWYAITLTSYVSPDKRQPFFQVACFLAKSMSKLYGARPHWAKLCTLPAHELRELYPNFQEFSRQCRSSDPMGVFQNHWTEELIKY